MRLPTSGKNALTVHEGHADGAGGAAPIRPIKPLLASRFEARHSTLQQEVLAGAHTKGGCKFTGFCTG